MVSDKVMTGLSIAQSVVNTLFIFMTIIMYMIIKEYKKSEDRDVGEAVKRVLYQLKGKEYEDKPDYIG